MSLRLTAISFKESWRDENGRWYSDGGFPRQMDAITSLFDQSDLLIVEIPRKKDRKGELPLPPVNIVPLRPPTGVDLRRKISVVWHLPYYLKEIARFVRACDVVHVPLPGDIPLLALLVAWAMGKPVIARYGGSWAATAETTFMNRVTRSCLRMMARGRHVILATGDGAELPAKGMAWIFSSAVSKAEVHSIRPVLNRGIAASPRLAFIGRLATEKGLPNLFRSLAALRSRPELPRPSLTLMGDGPERGNLERLAAELGCADQIRFAGQLNRSDLSRELLEADLCVQPSLTEGFSKAWLDAMAHGVPVVSSEVGAARAVVGRDGERGWLVPPGDEEMLTKRLAAVLSEPIDWPAMRRRCRDFAEQRTLEDWRDRIGEICADRWDWTFQQGKLAR